MVRIEDLDGLYQDVHYMINLRTKKERNDFFKIWLAENLGVEINEVQG